MNTVHATEAADREPAVSSWKVSLHGGHSSEYCGHARGRLRAILDAAVAYGFGVYGVTEHAPRGEARFLYPEEETLGWDVEKLQNDFRAYARNIRALAEEYADRLTILCGFEAEIVPTASYAATMLALREKHKFDYMVGSVHYVGEVLIDGTPEEFHYAAAQQGGLEALAVHYYQEVVEMVQALEPEIVGHLDVIRKNAPSVDVVESPAARRAAERALEAIRAHGCILDLNTAGWRKGLSSPYPAPWLVQRAHKMGVPFCFGDDSHGPEDVGRDLDRARDYLLKNGVSEITYLARDNSSVVRRTAPLA